MPASCARRYPPASEERKSDEGVQDHFPSSYLLLVRILRPLGALHRRCHAPVTLNILLVHLLLTIVAVGIALGLGALRAPLARIVTALPTTDPYRRMLDVLVAGNGVLPDSML